MNDPVFWSVLVYILAVLVPMIPSVVIYRMFPDTKVSATGVLSNLNFKTTGAFAAYVVTVFISFIILQNTNHLIANINNPSWTLKANVELLNMDGTPYQNNELLETLAVSIDPRLQKISAGKVTLTLPGDKKSWDTTNIKFEIPHFGYKIMDISEASDQAIVDDKKLIIKLNNPISIKVNQHMVNDYYGDHTTAELVSSISDGPELTTSERN